MSATSTDQLLDEYRATHPGSAALHQRASDYFAARGATHFVRIQAPFRPYITHALEARTWDVDGNEYVDYVMGHGALLLGHGHPAIVEAVQQQILRGVHLGSNHGMEVEWAELIRSMMPAAERIEFFACGQEANLLGLRLCRVVTGRRKVIRFAFNYHGWADELASPTAAGIVADQVVVIPPNDIDLLEQQLRSREFAAVLIEAGGGWLAGRVTIADEFYRALPELCRKYGTLFFLDEVVTGFREAPGGWQEVLGITPDLTSIGKAVSGGMAAGALLGRAELFQPLDPSSPPDRLVAHGGTWNAVPLTCAAGIAACRLYQNGEPQRAARAAAQRLVTRGNQVLKKHGVTGRFYGRSAVHLAFAPEGAAPTEGAAANRRLDLHLLHRGVSSILGEAFIVSAVHATADIDHTLNALDQSIAAMLDEGSLPP